MAFEEVNEAVDGGLKFPINGKTYLIPGPSAKEGMRLKLLLINPSTDFTDEGELVELMKLLGAEWVPNLVDVDLHDEATGLPVLIDDEDDPNYGQIKQTKIDNGEWRGGVWQEFVDDGVQWDTVVRVGRALFTNISSGRTMAEIMYQLKDGGADSNPFPPMPDQMNRAARRQADRKKDKKKR